MPGYASTYCQNNPKSSLIKNISSSLDQTPSVENVAL